ncbi:hypothetical protein [Gracilinema caldarium]|uniref:Uncharacterized protein n=1 Tax=Gracilinema caldarium (strain ATCC 51460 / DSM 7334 / H1) TaxID=744872 RepID=F8F1Z2_GRAC1|nr:hypothetical protein [Gracilinema caldarium]AEJ19839.1 hypothetical protein Spica_1696 [Gracilinema caldarium DSM 7334]
MILFSMLWIPALYLFVEALQQPKDREKKGMILAIFGGTVMGILAFFFPQLVPEGSFGIIQWIHGFIDVIALPVLIPLCFRYLLQIRYKHQIYIEINQFILIWLIPMALVKSIQWNIYKDGILLVLTPGLWGALSIGIPWLLEKAEEEIGFFSFFFYAMAYVLPLFATTAYWAWFLKLYLVAVLAAIVSFLPGVWYLVTNYWRFVQQRGLDHSLGNHNDSP